MNKKSPDLSPVKALPVLVPPCAAGAKPIIINFALVSPKPVTGFPQYFSFIFCFLFSSDIFFIKLVNRGHFLHLTIVLFNFLNLMFINEITKYYINYIFKFNKRIKADSEDQILDNLQKGGNLIFIRHAYAPGGGDPDNFDIKDCTTQRNLNDVGREQSKKIGKFFKENKIPIDLVISSEWCRCKETASIAFENLN